MPEISSRHMRNCALVPGMIITALSIAATQEAPSPPDAAASPVVTALPETASVDSPGVTGIGGLFFKAENPSKLKAWYEKHLGITPSDDGYIIFQWRDPVDRGQLAYTAWGPFKAETTYFDPSDKPFMFNYRVADLDALLKKLKADGVELVGEPETYVYGKFGWCMDPEGNKIELWEPDDEWLQDQLGDPAEAEVRAALETYYEDFSARDWDRFATHFHDGAVLCTVWIPPGEDSTVVMMSSVGEFITKASEGPGSQPIFEERMTRADIIVKGNLAQAWVTYEAKFGTEKNLREWSGIDAFSLLNHRGVWRIVSIAYVSLDGE